MAFRELNAKQNLVGFYSRELNNPMQGIVTKFINLANNPFFIVKLTAGTCKVNQQSADGKKYKKVIAKAGEWIGLAATSTIADLKEDQYKGKEVRVTWTGETPSKTYKGKNVQLFKLEVNDEAPAEDDHIS